MPTHLPDDALLHHLPVDGGLSHQGLLQVEAIKQLRLLCCSLCQHPAHLCARPAPARPDHLIIMF